MSLSQALNKPPAETSPLLPLTSFGGAKGIRYASGVMLLINNITGPGIPALPNLLAEAGWLSPLLCMLGVWGMTTLAASMLAEVMQHIPGNEGFEGRAEYSSVVRAFYAKAWAVGVQVGLIGALQSINLVSVLQSAQIMDSAIAAIFGRSCGINLTPYPSRMLRPPESAVVAETFSEIPGSSDFFSCVDVLRLEEGHPWGCHVVVSLGFALTAAVTITCGRFNLDDNMAIQRASFFVTFGCWLMWLAACFCAMGSRIGDGSAGEMVGGISLPPVNSEKRGGSQAAVLGTILFNFGFVTTVPSWINEKHARVSVNASLWAASSLSALVMLSVGLAGAVAFRQVLQGSVSGTCEMQACYLSRTPTRTPS